MKAAVELKGCNRVAFMRSDEQGIEAASETVSPGIRRYERFQAVEIRHLIERVVGRACNPGNRSASPVTAQCDTTSNLGCRAGLASVAIEIAIKVIMR